MTQNFLIYSIADGGKGDTTSDPIFVNSNIIEKFVILEEICNPIPKIQLRALKLQTNEVIRIKIIPLKI